MKIKIAILYFLCCSVLLIHLSACNSKQNTLKKIESSLKSYLSDWAFKENFDLKLLECKAIDFKMVTDREVDSMKRIELVNEMYRVKEIVKLSKELMELNADQILLAKESSPYTDSHLNNINYREYNKNKEQAQLYIDSFYFISKVDSVLEQKMKNSTTKKSHYL